MEPAVKLASIFADRNEAYLEAYRAAYPDIGNKAPELLAGEMIKFIQDKWAIDFLPYELDKIDDDPDKGRRFMRLMLAAYADEIEDVQADIGTRLRAYILFLQKLAPKLDFLDEIAPDSYVRRPLDRLWQMEPIAIFGDMSVSDDGEADALLDMLEKNFTPVISDVAATADRIRRNWFRWVRLEDDQDELIFYEIIERAVTHAVATESRMAATDWILRNFDGNAMLVGLLEIHRHGLECLGKFCSNCKFMSEHRTFAADLLESRG